MSDADALRLVEITAVLGDDKGRDPMRTLGGRIGARRDAEDFAHAGVGDEDLRAVQDVVVAAIDGGGLGAAGVRSGSRLGQPEPAQDFAAREQGHEPAFLLVGAEVHDRRRAERGMWDDGDVRQVIHPRPTQLLGPWNAKQPELRHLLHIVPGEAAVEIILASAGSDDLLGEVPDHLADLEMVVGEVERIVHLENIDGRGTVDGATVGNSTVPSFHLPSYDLPSSPKYSRIIFRWSPRASTYRRMGGAMFPHSRSRGLHKMRHSDGLPSRPARPAS